MLISGGEVDTERAAKMLVGEFRASKWGRLSLERPPQRAIQEDSRRGDRTMPRRTTTGTTTSSNEALYAFDAAKRAEHGVLSAAWTRPGAVLCAARSAARRSS